MFREMSEEDFIKFLQDRFSIKMDSKNGWYGGSAEIRVTLLYQAEDGSKVEIASDSCNPPSDDSSSPW